MSRPDVIDERFEEIVRELRSGRVAASPELRERVRELAVRPTQPPPEPLRPRLPRLEWRRSALVLAPAALLLVLLSALAFGVATSGQKEHAAAPPTPVPLEARGVGGAPSDATEALTQKAKAPGAGNLPATAGRAQDYQAELTLRVKDLSAATKRALRLTRAFGGYVRTVDFAESKTGSAYLVVRIPIGSVQEAIVRFSAMGKILSQRVSIQDLQPQLDQRFRQMQALRGAVAKLQARLTNPKLSASERAALEDALVQARRQLVALQRKQAEIQRRASFATVSLGLRTTEPAAAVPHSPGRIERAFDRSVSILLDEAKAVIYAVIVGAPLLVLIALGIAGLRSRRRRTEQRLLAR